jgi:hypothetical protein
MELISKGIATPLNRRIVSWTNRDYQTSAVPGLHLMSSKRLIRHVDYFRARRDSGPSSSMLPTGPASSRLYCMAIPCECAGPLPNVEVTSLKLEWFMVELRRRR